MEYIVSARKYRPASFGSVVGQQALTTTLKNAVASGKLAHAYLFCGPRGVGKTTCARIFAKVINCENQRNDGDACGECESCRAFAEQRSLNIFELDAASNNGVNEIKDLMDQTRIPPQVGKYKVFIIDEVHMLSQAAFNAFLKTLEEPPAHVVFILATTEKHKILPTILSRCQVYDFERMTVPNIINHLKTVADDQGITYEEEALNLIAEKADGGMRDALSIFDQAASFCQGNITYQKVVEDLNVLDADNYFRCLDLAMQTNVTETMVLLNSVLERGFDGGHFVTGLSAHIRNVLMAKDEKTASLIETSEAMRQKYVEQAKRCDTRFMYKALRILNDCDLNYRQSSNKRLLVELTLIEVAQILQKDDDASAGRLPWKILKSLFKKLTTQVPSQSAQQGSGSEHTVLRTGHQQSGESVVRPSSPAAATSTPGSASTPTSGSASTPTSASGSTSPDNTTNPPTTPSAPKIKIGGLGMSFGNLMKPKAGPVVDQSAGEKAAEVVDFTDGDLQRVWLAMCNRMAQNQQFTGLANRLRNIVPAITEYPNIEVLVENEMLKDEISQIRRRLEATVSRDLHNGNVTLSIRVAEAAERKKFLTPKATFDEMNETFEVFKFLNEQLELDFE